jgi:shikimate kinase
MKDSRNPKSEIRNPKSEFGASDFGFRISFRLLFLIGYRGSGKTTVARLVAEGLGWPWLDADAVLEERHGQTIRQIFAVEGEAGFRDKEAAVLADLCRLERHVIATGGGVVLRPANRELLKQAGRIVWLTADAATLHVRMHGDATTHERRPALSVGGLAEVEELLRQREPFYRECAHKMEDTVGRSPEQVAASILDWWRNRHVSHPE